jgi:uncharacterized iron-regulated membrane protein
MKMPTRYLVSNVVIQLHKYVGLLLGGVIAIIAASGAMCLYTSAMFRAEFPELFAPGRAASAPTTPPQIERWNAAIDAAHPELRTAMQEGFLAPGAFPIDSDAWIAVRVYEHAGEERHAFVAIDAARGTSRGWFAVEESWSYLPVKVHGSLAAGGIGFEIVAWSGVALLLLMIAGVYLWWIRPGRAADKFKIRGRSNRLLGLLDWHNVPGVYAWVPIFVLALSGLYYSKPHWIEGPTRAVSKLTAPDPETLAVAAPNACAARTTHDDAIAIALAAFPGQALTSIAPMPEPKPLYLVNLALPNNIGRTGNTQVWVDGVCPRLLATVDGRSLTSGEKFLHWLEPLHSHLALGNFGRIVALVASLVLLGLFVTGTWMWLFKRSRIRASSTLAEP